MAAIERGFSLSRAASNLPRDVVSVRIRRTAEVPREYEETESGTGLARSPDLDLLFRPSEARLLGLIQGSMRK